MKSLIVVGGGIAGSSAARVALDKGWDVTLIDHQQVTPAAWAALATLRPSWLTDEAKTYAGHSWAWVERWGAAITRQATVTNWRTPAVTQQDGWWLCDPSKLLAYPHITSKIELVTEDGRVFGDRYEGQADAVLVCTGAHSPELMPVGKPTWGGTFVSRQARAVGAPLRVHHTRPYHSITVGDLGHEVRVGSSVSTNKDRAAEEAREMLRKAIELELVTPANDWELIMGLRARHPGNKPILPQAGHRVAYLGGLARSGYAISPHAAALWLESL